MGNRSTTKKKNNSGQQRFSLTTEQSNNSEDQGSNLTSEQSNNSGQQRGSLTTEQSNNSEDQGSNLTSEQSNNSEDQGSNLTSEQSNNSEDQGSNLTTEQLSFNDEESLIRTYVYEESSEEGHGSTADQEKCYDPQDPTLTFVDGEDEMDFLRSDYTSLRAKMSCGHAVTPMSLTNWCRWLLDQGKCRFVCGQTNCDAEWSFVEVRKMALLSPEEEEEFEKKRFSNSAKHYLDIKECPGCKCYVVRTNLSDLSVRCTVCAANRESTYIFCWQCLREWKGPAPRSDCCDNDGCDYQLEILRNCPDVVFKSMSKVRGCPSTRACPTCGVLVKHDGTGCKNVACSRCKVSFCFVCLKTTTECQKIKPYSYFDVCPSGVAPRQTSIPVWQSR